MPEQHPATIPERRIRCKKRFRPLSAIRSSCRTHNPFFLAGYKVPTSVFRQKPKSYTYKIAQSAFSCQLRLPIRSQNRRDSSQIPCDSFHLSDYRVVHFPEAASAKLLSTRAAKSTHSSCFSTPAVSITVSSRSSASCSITGTVFQASISRYR